MGQTVTLHHFLVVYSRSAILQEYAIVNQKVQKAIGSVEKKVVYRTLRSSPKSLGPSSSRDLTDFNFVVKNYIIKKSNPVDDYFLNLTSLFFYTRYFNRDILMSSTFHSFHWVNPIRSNSGGDATKFYC